MFLVAIIIQGAILYYYNSNAIINRYEGQLTHSTDLVDQKFSSYLDEIQKDILHISASPYLQKYLSTLDENDKILLEREYMSVISSKADLSQIRFIGIEDQGKEMIRVERRENEILITTKEKLQQKGNRNYFKETIGLKKGMVYISNINLNKEYGEISLPKTPTLRVASPVFLDGELKGVLVINTNLTILFKALETIVDKEMKLFLLNNEGHYIIHPDTTKSYGFEYGKPALFNEDFKSSPVKIIEEHQNIFHQNNIVYNIQHVDFPKANYDLYCLLAADRSVLLSEYYQWQRNFIFITLSLTILFSIIAFIYFNGHAKELKVITEKMKSFPETLEISDLPVERNDEIGILARVFEDMSEIIHSNIQSLEEAKRKAELADNEKQEFLENMSHEIRNPLHSIFGLSEVLEQNHYLAHQEKIIQNLKFNASNLNSLLNDILDYKKLLQNEIQLAPKWDSLQALIEAIYASHQYYAKTKQIRYEYKIDGSIAHKAFFIDKLRLSQVINNLLINAIKFTAQKGAVSLVLELLSDDGSEMTLNFKIIDNGIGIEENLIEKVKERYHSNHTNDAFLNSFGIGLNIVIELLKCHDSELQIHSEKGKGSEFSFHLTFKYRESDELDDEKQDDIAILKDKKLLIIDDDEQIIALYEHVFDSCCKLTTVSSAEELMALEVATFDVVISDFRIGKTQLTSQADLFHKFMSKESLMYVISAHEIGDLKNIFPAYRGSFRKPVEIRLVLKQLCRDLGIEKYGIPNTTSIKKDYDYKKEKYIRAFQLLLSDWTQLGKSLPESVAKRDKDAFYEITHKMITTVRRLELSAFEKMLDHIEANFDQEDHSVFEKELREAIFHYIQCIKDDID